MGNRHSMIEKEVQSKALDVAVQSYESISNSPDGLLHMTTIVVRQGAEGEIKHEYYTTNTMESFGVVTTAAKDIERILEEEGG